MRSLKIFLTIGVLHLVTGCVSNQYSVTYASDPSGAQLYCNGVAKGYTPVTLYYTLDKETKKNGILNTQPCGVKWVSGASGWSNTVFDLNQFPNGVITTTPRPDVEGYSQDAEFALKVMSLRASERTANAAEQTLINTNYQNNNTINCKKSNEFLNYEIKTFSGMLCPSGWLPAY